MEKPQNFHFIAMGGSQGCDLAIALRLLGHSVTFSDDALPPEIEESLRNHHLLPVALGWFPERISTTLDAVILASHVKADNPEIKKALELKIPILSFPEFIYQHSTDQQRIVIAGSHGKTMITALLIHVLTYYKRKFDFVTTAVPEGQLRVRLSNAPLIIIESQDHRCSAVDATPAFIAYQHHIGVIPGIEWQPSSDYPTKEVYLQQFNLFGGSTPKGGSLVYFELDSVVAALPKMDKPDVTYISYKTHPSDVQAGQEYLLTPDKKRLALRIQGKHNLQNISAALETLKKIGITQEHFYQAISSFEGIRN